MIDTLKDRNWTHMVKTEKKDKRNPLEAPHRMEKYFAEEEAKKEQQRKDVQDAKNRRQTRLQHARHKLDKLKNLIDNKAGADEINRLIRDISNDIGAARADKHHADGEHHEEPHLDDNHHGHDDPQAAHDKLMGEYHKAEKEGIAVGFHPN
jgi:hypothetical protein